MDGAGVRLKRVFGGLAEHSFDPFLLLDEFDSERPDDYIRGFPWHPHRGFETVTYMLEGQMLHKDHLGNEGRLVGGSVQWMTAARGIIHSEMPQQVHGRLHGFQLWINLPAAEKMKPAAYRDIPTEDIPVVTLDGGTRIRIIAGEVTATGERIKGAVQGISTEPLYLDVELTGGAEIELPVPSGHTALVYVFQGALQIDDGASPRDVARQHLAALSQGDSIVMRASGDRARALVLAAKPLREPVVQYGPFVMTTRQEIQQAIWDYEHGQLV